MPNQVYRFDPDTGVVRVVADGFDKPNGIAFSQDGSIAYMLVHDQNSMTETESELLADRTRGPMADS